MQCALVETVKELISKKGLCQDAIMISFPKFEFGDVGSELSLLQSGSRNIERFLVGHLSRFTCSAGAGTN